MKRFVLITTLIAALVLPGCAAKGPDPATTLNTVQRGYTALANVEVVVIASGVLPQKTIDVLKAVDNEVYVSLVAFRTAVESGKPVPAAVVTSLRASLTHLKTYLGGITEIKPEILVALDLAFAALNAYLPQ